MPIEFTNRQEKGSPLTMLEMDAILDLLKDAINGQESLMSISLNPDGTLKNPGFLQGASTNGTDSYTATVTGVTSQNDLLNKILILTVDVANSGPATLNANGYGTFPIARFQDQLLETGYIKASTSIILTWDGALYIMQSMPGVTQPANYALDTGAANAMVVARSGWIDIPAVLYPGYSIRVKVAVANTGPTNITLASLPAQGVKRSDGTDLLPNDFTVGMIADLIYDGINFQVPQLGTVKSFSVAGGHLSTYLGGLVEFAHGLGGEPDFYQICAVCNTAEHGYSIGNALDVGSIQVNDPGTAERASFSPYATSTHIGVSVNDYGGGNRFGIRHKTSGAQVSLTEASWDLRFRAFML